MMIEIFTIEDFKQAINHPYRSGEYFSDGSELFQVSDNIEEVQEFIESYECGLEYHINWEDDMLYDNYGEQIEAVYTK